MAHDHIVGKNSCECVSIGWTSLPLRCFRSIQQKFKENIVFAGAGQSVDIAAQRFEMVEKQFSNTNQANHAISSRIMS